MKVLATGATGQYAHHVVTALVAQGVDVRGVVHDQAKADEARRAGATETIEVDLADTDGIADALHGVDGVFLITPAFHPEATTMGLNVVNAAADASIGKLVYNGVYHPSLSLPNHAGTRPIEEALYASDLDFTILQPAMYVQALEAAYRDALESGTVTAPWSKHSKMTYVDYRDVAEVAATAFTDPRLSRGTFELAAGGMVDRIEIAEMMSRVAGRSLVAEDMDDAPSGPADLATMFADYDQVGFHGGNSLVLQAILQRQPRSVANFIAGLGDK
ncbi:MAG: NmrA family NAD(P)-binding protein [Mycobacterium sp.]|uniref:SDR family oxidoreductase n=1 Tax=Mycobacterium sp. TaxID=1785 RepID=UPI001EB87B38|nr:NmrA family NAD(P)-binding protein [Mycobacterium sp.]MBV8787011.1 NmrA family NAD(P)-binding protein [Mycobacterium sp.]